MTRRLDRQLDIIKSEDMQETIHVLGAGGIGSWTVLMLAKMGCENIIVYDNDVVENHNVASQFFKESQLGELKVEALRDSVLEQTGIEIEIEEKIKQEEYIKDGMIIMALDSMSERKRLGEIYAKETLYIIDGRMGGLSMEIYSTLTSKYLETIVPEEEIEPTACTARAISFNCSVIAGLIVDMVRISLSKSEIFFGELFFCFNSFTLIKREYKTVGLSSVTHDGSPSLMWADSPMTTVASDHEFDNDGEEIPEDL